MKKNQYNPDKIEKKWQKYWQEKKLYKTPKDATPENKFGKILIAHGVELGVTIDTSPLIGTEVRIMVEDYEYEEDKNKKIASTITKVKPLSEVDKD